MSEVNLDKDKVEKFLKGYRGEDDEAEKEEEKKPGFLSRMLKRLSWEGRVKNVQDEAEAAKE